MRNLQPESMPEHLKNAGYLISHGCKYIFKGEKKMGYVDEVLAKVKEKMLQNLNFYRLLKRY